MTVKHINYLIHQIAAMGYHSETDSWDSNTPQSHNYAEVYANDKIRVEYRQHSTLVYPQDSDYEKTYSVTLYFTPDKDKGEVVYLWNNAKPAWPRKPGDPLRIYRKGEWETYLEKLMPIAKAEAEEREKERLKKAESEKNRLEEEAERKRRADFAPIDDSRLFR